MKKLAVVAISGLALTNARHHHEEGISGWPINGGVGPVIVHGDEFSSSNEGISGWPAHGGHGPVITHGSELSADEGIKGWPKWGGLGPVITHGDELSRKEARKVFGDIGKFLLGALDDSEVSKTESSTTHEEELSRKEARKVFGAIGKFLLGALDEREITKSRSPPVHEEELSKAGREAGKIFESAGQDMLHGLIFGDETHENELSRKEARKVFGDIGKFLLGALDEREMTNSKSPSVHEEELSKAGREAGKVFEKIGQGLLHSLIFSDETHEVEPSAHEEELSRREAGKVFGGIGKFLLGALDEEEVSKTSEEKPIRKNLRGSPTSIAEEPHEEELSRKEARKVFGAIGKFLLGALDDNEFYHASNGGEEELTHWGIEDN